MSKLNFTTGKQPCVDFRPRRERNGYGDWDNEHSCYGPFDGVTPAGLCTVTVSNCETCGYDHHRGGWQTCPVRAREDSSDD